MLVASLLPVATLSTLSTLPDATVAPTPTPTPTPVLCPVIVKFDLKGDFRCGAFPEAARALDYWIAEALALPAWSVDLDDECAVRVWDAGTEFTSADLKNIIEAIRTTGMWVENVSIACVDGGKAEVAWTCPPEKAPEEYPATWWKARCPRQEGRCGAPVPGCSAKGEVPSSRGCCEGLSDDGGGTCTSTCAQDGKRCGIGRKCCDRSLCLRGRCEPIPPTCSERGETCGGGMRCCRGTECGEDEICE